MHQEGRDLAIETKQIEAQSQQLRKVLSVRDLVLAQILYIMGMGWVGVAGKLGSSHVVFWLLAITLFYVPSALVVIYLNRLMPLEGGLYQWAKFGFNERLGFLVAWNLWVYLIILNSEIGIQSCTMLAYAMGPRGAWLLENRFAMVGASVLLISLITAVTVAGLGLGRWVQNAGGALMIVTFLALVALPFRNVLIGRMASYQPFQLSIPDLTLLNLNILGKMGFAALGGFEFMAIFAAECRDGGRAVGRSVLWATPIIALLFVLGTSAVVAFTPASEIDLVGPIPQALTRGTVPSDPGASLIPLLVFAVLAIRIAQCTQSFAGNSRMPLVAGWDDLLPKWFTKIDPKWRTPVNSILFVGGLTMLSGLWGIAGTGRAEGFQILNNTSGILYGLTYLAMFAVPVVGLRSVTPRPPRWLRAAAISGFGMTLLYVVLSVWPIIDVPNPLQFAAKVGGAVLVVNFLGFWIHWAYQKRLLSGG
jgi:amino acid transporter